MQNKTHRVALAALALVLMFTFLVQAQDSRRVSPAFPIGAGEKMLVIQGQGSDGFGSTPGDMSQKTLSRNPNSATWLAVSLPVGTTIKRVLGDFIDQVSANLTVKLVRLSNADQTTQVTLREFDTSGISSASDTDAKQIVANPLTHTMLQGWTYWIVLEWPNDTYSFYDLGVSVIKIIYEP